MSRDFGSLLTPWVRATLRTEDRNQSWASGTTPVCYVLENASRIDLNVLQEVCIRERLPRPGRRLLPAQLGKARANFALRRRVGLWRSRLDRRPSPKLLALIKLLEKSPDLDVCLVPTAVYWGRAPAREHSALRRLLSDDWVVASGVRRFLTVVLNGRNTTVQFGEPLSLRALLATAGDSAVGGRTITRALTTQLTSMRTARIGPDLSHRRTIVHQVVASRAVRAVVAQSLRVKKTAKSRRDALQEARQNAMEIAANYSPAFVLVMSHVLKWVWNRLYDGVDFRRSEVLTQVADDHEIVYVPCHRSHMDYLLLSYAIYQRGFAIPHIAAGLNLNLPVVGRFLRKGGAFFVRRSFRGNAIYTAVFSRYVEAMMSRGHSIEYFIEGGRSRTGRLLPPMTGMLAMTVRAYLHSRQRPVVFIPVYFGYERVVELPSYVDELSGRPKEKESTLALVRSVWRLLTRERMGRVQVSLGEPLHLNALLEQHAPEWRTLDHNEPVRAPWVGDVAEQLGERILRNVNAAAVVNPINLLCLVLLATPRQAMLEPDLVAQLQTLLAVLRELPYSPMVSVAEYAPEQMPSYGAALKVLVREAAADGTTIVRMTPEQATLAVYYRNNVLHLFALPSLIACCFLGHERMETADIQRLAGRIYPYVAAELFLRWEESELPVVVQQALESLVALELLEKDAQGGWRRPASASTAAVRLSMLAQTTVQTIERYYLAIAVMTRAGSGELSPRDVEERCQSLVQKMDELYGVTSPEFFDRRLCQGFVSLLKERKVIWAADDGKLQFGQALLDTAADAQWVLSEQIRHSILQVTLG